MFSIINYNGYTESFGYTLSITPFTFVPDPAIFDGSISKQRILWDFGDGTTSESLCAQHYYSIPGEYTIKLFTYDGSGNRKYTFTQSITAYDFITDTFKITGEENLTAGHVESPYTIHRFNSWQSWSSLSAEGYSFFLDVSGNISPFIDVAEYNKNKYAHLYAASKFLDESKNPIDSIQSTSHELWARIEIDEIPRVVLTSKNAPGSIFVGTSGECSFFYVDDTPADEVILFVKQDLSGFPLNKYKIQSKYSPLNKIPNNISCSIQAQSGDKHLSFSTNGIDGEGEYDDTFNIAEIKYQGTHIPFVVKVKDNQEYSTKYTDDLGDVSLAAHNDGGLILGNFVKIESGPGFYRGYFEAATSSYNVRFSAEIEIGGDTITGESNVFNIIDQGGVFNIAKINENIDFKELYKSYRFQEAVQNTPVLFDDYLGTIAGDISSPSDSIGKRLYEKTANFVDNNARYETCNINALRSLFGIVGADATQFDQNNFLYPANLSRLTDLISIKYSVLKGTRNKDFKNFDSFGYVNNPYFGINLGDEIDIASTKFTAGSGDYIVAYEKFSETYILVDTNIPFVRDTQGIEGWFGPEDEDGSWYCAEDGSWFIDEAADGKDSTRYFVYEDVIYINLIDGDQYSLLQYDEKWGWGLVLPAEYEVSQLSAYYVFYDYVPGTDNILTEGIINWEDQLTTLSENIHSVNYWLSAADSLISHQLYKGLDIFEDRGEIIVDNIGVISEDDFVIISENDQWRIVTENSATA